MTDSKILRVANLNVSLGGESTLEDLSFDLGTGEILVVLGPNGAGKTILLRALLGVIPCEGAVSWREGARLGYVPEGVVPLENFPLSVEEFFHFKDSSSPEVSEALAWVGMGGESFPQRRLDKLSFGQFKRVLIAWALVGKPQAILLDEPLLGIDIHGRQTIYDSLVKLWRERDQAIILVSHELGEVCKEADKVLAINKKLLFYGPPEEVVTPDNLAKIYGHSISL